MVGRCRVGLTDADVIARFSFSESGGRSCCEGADGSELAIIL